MPDLLYWIGRRARETEELERRARDARIHVLFDRAPIDGPPPVVSTAVSSSAVPEGTPRDALPQVEERVVRDGQGRITAMRMPADQSADSVDERDRLKTELMGLASHQLRTPLTSIKGYAALLIDGEAGELSDDQRELVEVIRRNSDRLVALLEDVVSLARIPSAVA